MNIEQASIAFLLEHVGAKMISEAKHIASLVDKNKAELIISITIDLTAKELKPDIRVKTIAKSLEQ